MKRREETIQSGFGVKVQDLYCSGYVAEDIFLRERNPFGGRFRTAGKQDYRRIILLNVIQFESL